MDILRPSPMITERKQYTVIITESSSKLTKAIPTPHIITTSVACIILHDWIIPYGIHTYFLTDIDAQFTSTFLAELCTDLGRKQRNTITCRSQTNGQVERYNKTIVTRISHYVRDRQRDKDIFAQPLIYAYNTAVHRFTNTTLINLKLPSTP